MFDRVDDIAVQGALAVLILFSVATWTLIAVKGLESLRARRADVRFRRGLRKTTALPAARFVSRYAGPTARVAVAGTTAWEAHAAGTTVDQVSVRREILELSLQRQIQQERRVTEKRLAILASIGTTAPFIGVFGTVFGILQAFRSVRSTSDASLDVVLGPIGDALAATGVGIAVAVPAVLAYNYFVRRSRLQAEGLEDFARSLVAAALASTLPDARPLNTSGERTVRPLSELRAAASLREAARG